MTDPIGTAQERELIERLRKVESSGDFLGDGEEYGVTCSYRNPDGPEAADALQSRIAEVGRLTARVREIVDAYSAWLDADIGANAEEMNFLQRAIERAAAA